MTTKDHPFRPETCVVRSTIGFNRWVEGARGERNELLLHFVKGPDEARVRLSAPGVAAMMNVIFELAKAPECFGYAWNKNRMRYAMRRMMP